MMKALLYGKGVGTLPQFAHIFSNEYWENLREQFKEMQFAVQGITYQSLLETLVGSGLTALKTPFCQSGNTDNYNCPICKEKIYILAKNLPYCTKSTSNLICRILGVIMDEHNPPVMLPNNQIFSTKGIEKIAKHIHNSSEKKVVCPITMDEFKTSQISKIFLTS
jgi:macrophage erythroblast attacher